MKMRSGTCHWTRCRLLNSSVMVSEKRGLSLSTPPRPNTLLSSSTSGTSSEEGKGQLLPHSRIISSNDSSGDSKGALIKSIAQSKSHLFMLCEATNVTQGEKDFLYSRGWQTIQNNSGDIIIGSRTNLMGSSPYALSRLDTCRGSSCASATYLYDRRNHIW